MNIGGLIDIRCEEDHLIDCEVDGASLDLRLSIAYDNDTTVAPNAGRKVELKSRQSLAWDSAFFSSAGILDLKELSLVNEGFQNETSKGFERGAIGETQAESFLELRLSDLQSSKHHHPRKPSASITSFKSSILAHSQGRDHSLQSKYGAQPQMRFVKHQTSTTHQMSSGGEVRPPRVETRASAGHVTPRSAAYRPSNPGKRWVCKSLDLEPSLKPSLRSSAEDRKKVGGSIDVKRSLGPLPGEVSKNPSRASHRHGFFQMKQGAAKKEHGGSGGLKKRESKRAVNIQRLS